MGSRTQAIRGFAHVAAVIGLVAVTADAQQAPPPPPPGKPPAAAQVEKLGPNKFRIGNVSIDTEKKEVSVRGVSLEVTAIEFIANTKGGLKAYESALELETDAISFNAALLLIGMDPARSTPAKMHLQQEPPKGDPVEVWIEWQENGKPRRIRAEELVYNSNSKQTLTEGPWVYAGSVFSPDGQYYQAESEGVLIGFVHSPAPIIESPRPLGVGAYGSNMLNPALGLKAGTAVTLTVRALPRK